MTVAPVSYAQQMKDNRAKNLTAVAETAKVMRVPRKRQDQEAALAGTQPLYRVYLADGFFAYQGDKQTAEDVMDRNKGSYMKKVDDVVVE